MRYRHAGVGGSGDGGRDAGDDFEGDAGGCEGERFFAAAAEDEGVAALEPDDALARRGLCRRGTSLISSCVSALRSGDLPAKMRSAPASDVVEDGGADEPVVDNDVGCGETVAPGQGQQTGVAGTGADQRDEAASHMIVLR